MVRKTSGVVLLLVFMGVVAGCGPRERPGLLARFRARSAMPDCPPYCSEGLVMDSGACGQAPGIPCCAPTNGGMPIRIVPGTVIPGTPETMPLPGNGVPPLNPQPGVAPPGSAPPRPADPSADPTGLRKGAVPASKTGAIP
jgi:hypothetical protein